MLNIISEGISQKKKNEEIIDNIINKIQNNTKIYTCVIPIHGVLLKKEYDMGIVKLYPYKKREEVIEEIYKEKAQKFIKDSFKSCSDFATINVTALQPLKAVEKAVSEVNKSLNILKFLFCSDNNIYQIGVGKKSESMTDKEFLAISNDQNEGVVTHPFKYTPIPADVDKIAYDGNKVVKKLIKIQSKIFKHKKTIPLEKSLFNALNLIVAGLYSDDYETQMSKFMSAIEALVEQKTFTQGITDQVCERTALLLGKTFDARKKMYNKMIELYSKRSAISHGDSANINMYDTNYLWQASSRLLFYLLNNFDNFVDSNNNPKLKMKDYILTLRFR
ncbi:hypothetical protein DY102_07170 [Apilactobacillus timberlakei]|uniref:HEPN domain-containing protein n=1 Tax=Apilactobacillus timberlakei TaxID=2008380 RepID=UPI0015E844CE|nr:HEPN domain-containing protein [Apilactobacillus timberlakei]TPR21464.1 hypothetical protein DY102_07170 [Apilactobacillus timberlakei]